MSPPYYPLGKYGGDHFPKGFPLGKTLYHFPPWGNPWGKPWGNAQLPVPFPGLSPPGNTGEIPWGKPWGAHAPPVFPPGKPVGKTPGEILGFTTPRVSPRGKVWISPGGIGGG